MTVTAGKKLSKPIRRITLPLSLAMSLLLTGCHSQAQSSTIYHSENYGFSLSIPNEIYEKLVIEDEPETNRVVFCHYHENEAVIPETGDVVTIPVWGHFFRIHILPLSDPAPGKEYDGVYRLLAQDNQYSYFFWYLIPDQCESDPLRKVYEPVFERVKEIPNSFALDES